MAHKFVLGIVGAIGAGKSRVAGLLAERGGRVIDGDAIGHAALRDPAIRARVVERFGRGILGDDGEIARRKLAAIVFAGDAPRRDLEAIVYPWIDARITEHIATAQADPAVRFVVLDAAVMLETGWNKACDRIVYVDAPRAVRLARLASRGWTADHLDARERAQMSAAEKIRRSDAGIDNGGDLAATARQVDELLTRWTPRPEQSSPGTA